MKDRIFNIHPSFLPEERGGGVFSWRILNNKNFVAATIHLVDEGIDSGAIVLQKKEELREPFPTPHSMLENTNDLYVRLLGDFLSNAKNQGKISFSPQKSFGSYLPRLYTEKNGAIDWSWDIHEIERFVRAFSYPYPGAFSFLKDQRVHILECRVFAKDDSIHSFCAGRFYSMDAQSVLFLAKGGILAIDRITVNGEEKLPSEVFDEQSILFTPQEDLDGY